MSIIYSIHIPRHVAKQLKRIPNPFRTRIEKAIDQLTQNPYPHQCKKLEGYTDLWRLRVGDYRILYRIAETIQVIEIDTVEHRQSVYKN